jgi:hypothetical protein
MNTAKKFKQAALVIIAMTSVALSTNLKADQPTEPLENVKLFGVINTVDEERNVRHIQPSASSITEQRNGGLTTLTLSQTFTNTSDGAVKGYYHLPLPNPGALISYEVQTDNTQVQLDDPQQLALEQGESITYTVSYLLNESLLVGFHQTDDLGINTQLDDSLSIAQK